MSLKYNMLENIHANFDYLLINCTDGITFIPPDNEIKALLLVTQIIDLQYKYNHEYSYQNMIIMESLKKIIIIKCNEFCLLVQAKGLLYDIDSFILSFNEYFSKLYTQYYNEFDSNMKGLSTT